MVALFMRIIDIFANFVSSGLEINFFIHLLAGNKKEKSGCQIKKFGHQFQKHWSPLTTSESQFQALDL